MTQFLQVFTVLYVSIFISDKIAHCKNIADVVVKNETEFPTTTTVNRVRTAEWQEDQTWNLTRDCNSKSNDGTAIILKNVVKRLAKSAINSTINTTTTITTTAITTITTSKMKTRKPGAIVVTMRSSSKRFLQNVTRPAKSVKKISGAFNVRNAKTTGPKPNMRLSSDDGSVHKTLHADDDVRTPSRNASDKLTAVVATTDFKSKYPTKLWRDHGFYTDDYIKLINGHWFKFMPPRPLSHYILGFLYVIIMVFGCFGNFLVIFMYIK